MIGLDLEVPSTSTSAILSSPLQNHAISAVRSTKTLPSSGPKARVTEAAHLAPTTPGEPQGRRHDLKMKVQTYLDEARYTTRCTSPHSPKDSRQFPRCWDQTKQTTETRGVKRVREWCGTQELNTLKAFKSYKQIAPTWPLGPS